MAGHVYQFGPFRLDERARILLRDGEPVSITPKVFETLLFLVMNAGRTVPREELIQSVWPDTFVEEGNLNYNMSQLRKILGEREPGIPYVQTMPKVGYRFVAEIQQIGPEAEREAAATAKISPPEPRLPRMRRRVMVGILAAAMAALLTAGAWWLWNSNSKRASTRPNLRQLTYDAGMTDSPALSPDAKLVAYKSDREEPGRSDIWVQQTSGGPALRLTKGPADHSAPVFSADGSKIYFASLGTPQGIYSVSPLGGELRLVATDGNGPSISPDGRSIAYVDRLSAELRLMPAIGGPPRVAAPGYSLASRNVYHSDVGAFDNPLVWSPDSRQICFFGQKTGQPQTLDYWVVRADGGTPQPTGWRLWAAQHRVKYAAASAWLPGDVLVLWMNIADPTQIYRVRFDKGNWHFLSEPEALTLGTSMDNSPSVAAGKIAFASYTSAEGVWMIPADTNHARLTGPLQKLTVGKALHSDASLTPDGRTLVFCSKRTEATDIYLRDMVTGAEHLLVTDHEEKISPLISADGTAVVYTTQTTAGDPWAVFEVQTSGGPQRKICDDCGPPRSLSPDGKWFLASRTDGPRPHITLVDVKSGHSTVFLQHSRQAVEEPRLSPDGKWIAFLMRHDQTTDILQAQFRGEQSIPEDDWVTVTSMSGSPGLTDVFWSPNGELLYYVSMENGQETLMAQRLGGNRRPIDPPFVVHSFSGFVRPGRAGTWWDRDRLNAVPGRIIGTMKDDNSNIWLMDLPR